MSTVKDEPLLDSGEHLNLYESADKILRFAEDLQGKCELYEGRLRWMFVIILGTLPVMGILIACLTMNGPVKESMILSVITDILLLYVLSMDVYVIYVLRVATLGHLAGERRALYRIVDMLRDLELGIVRGNALSTLEQIEFKIRLSRFDIGPGTSTPSTGPRQPTR